jgi:DnaD/phage-associated family protein
MAGRPRKHTAEYFPHFTDASEGRTLTILQNRFGNDGYSAWFRILERLGRSDGHYYDCSRSEDWNYLIAKLHISDITASEILDLLAELGAIDRELWTRKIIWCQKFVDGLSQLYSKRKDEVPPRPFPHTEMSSYPSEMPIPATEIPCTEPPPKPPLASNDQLPSPEIPISASVNTQRKIDSKESKVKEVKEIAAIAPVIRKYEDVCGLLNSSVADKLVDAVKEYSAEWVTDALQLAAEMNKRNWAYTEGILKKWAVEGRNNGHKSTGIPARPAATSDPTQADLEREFGVGAPLTGVPSVQRSGFRSSR